MNTKKLKKCLSLFATGITSIVTKKSKNYIGITVNSFSSVSLEPPLVMWCIDKKSSSIKSFLKVKNKYERESMTLREKQTLRPIKFQEETFRRYETG